MSVFSKNEIAFKKSTQSLIYLFEKFCNIFNIFAGRIVPVRNAPEPQPLFHKSNTNSKLSEQLLRAAFGQTQPANIGKLWFKKLGILVYESYKVCRSMSIQCHLIRTNI